MVVRMYCHLRYLPYLEWGYLHLDPTLQRRHVCERYLHGTSDGFEDMTSSKPFIVSFQLA
jgi:hypothetical protein